MTSLVCAHCGTTRDALAGAKGPRLPRGWKRLPDGLTCPTCVEAGWVLRAHTIPIAGPVDAEWSTLRPALKEGFAAVTAARRGGAMQLTDNQRLSLEMLRELVAQAESGAAQRVGG